jgi:hypothetical protein
MLRKISEPTKFEVTSNGRKLPEALDNEYY